MAECRLVMATYFLPASLAKKISGNSSLKIVLKICESVAYLKLHFCKLLVSHTISYQWLQIRIG